MKFYFFNFFFKNPKINEYKFITIIQIFMNNSIFYNSFVNKSYSFNYMLKILIEMFWLLFISKVFSIPKKLLIFSNFFLFLNFYFFKNFFVDINANFCCKIVESLQVLNKIFEKIISILQFSNFDKNT